MEVLNTATNKWYVATPLPYDAPHPSLTVIQDTLYVVWGCSAVSLSIPILISDAVSQRPTTRTSSGPQSTKWQPLPDTPTVDPATTSLLGSLVAVGGDPTSSSIAMYLPHMEQWLEVAQLPIPHQHCTCGVELESACLSGQGCGLCIALILPNHWAASVAQWLEHLSSKQCVVGSNPTRAALFSFRRKKSCLG